VRNRKGFTLIELLVVLAIIAAMSLMIVPLSSNNDVALEANAKARSFYFGLQRVMTQYKLELDSNLSGTLPPPSPLGGFDRNYYIEVEVVTFPGGAWSMQGYEISYSPDFVGLVYPKKPPVPLTDVCRTLYERLRVAARDADKKGWFYGQVDENYRVVKTYFSEQRLDGGAVFMAENRVNHNIVGAFPPSSGLEGEYVFG